LILGVALGAYTGILLGTLESRRKLRPTLVAPLLLLTGGLALRWIIVLAGQA
jgi:formate-dependent nitrite reductase membrane component NrfD